MTAIPEATTAARSPSHTFVSHSGEDREFVDRFVVDLRRIGIDAWYSAFEIKAGDSIPEKMDEGLQACRFFVLVVSKSSAASPYVKMEIASAISRNAQGSVKKIICIKLDGTEPPALLQHLKWIDFVKLGYESTLKEVTDSILDVELRSPLGRLPTGDWEEKEL